MASITVTWQPNNGFTPITQRSTDNLPQHIKGTAYWVTHSTRPGGYYYEEPGQEPVPIEFVNDVWHILHFSCTEQIFGTCLSYQIDPNNQNIGLGRWLENDPANLNNQSTQIIQVKTTNLTKHQVSIPEASKSESEHNQATWGPDTAEHISEDLAIAEPGPLDEALAATLDPIVSIQGPLPLDPPVQLTMSVNVTTTAPAQNAPSSGGMRGVPPTIFDGTQSCTDEFWAQFCRFRMVNQSHEAMIESFNWVLTALTYIWGPLINNWVDNQEKVLTDRIDTTQRNWVREDNEVLWQEFETAFHDAWTNTGKKQNAYNQLMCLTMNSWDIDTYIAMFDWLALAAGWDSDSEGTIAKFWEGLNKGVHSKALDRDRIPCTITEWKAAARTKVAQAKEKYNVGLTGNQCRNPLKTGTYSNTQSRVQTNQNNSGIVPMEVDNATGQTNFKKLTPKERAQLTKEGCCFQCRLQGHMARDCPKNANWSLNSNMHETTTENKGSESPSKPTTTNTTPPTKLTKARQIHAIEESMEDEERASYLDSRDMGLDFWSAGA